jgi:Cell Wall Hydrolase
MPDLSQRDLDLITRTVIGEAGDEPELGKAAVAHVIFNRMKQKDANDAASVVLAPKQFTTWQDRPAELARISPRSKAYQDAYDIVQNAAGGDIPDPTNGALNYANIDIVRRAGNTSAMKWINRMDNVSKIGSHTFGNADGVRASNDIEGDKEFLRSFGNPSTAASGATSNFDADRDFLKSYSSKGATPADDIQNAPSNIPVPEANMSPDQKADYQASLARGGSPKTALQRFREAIDPVSALKQAGSTVLDKASQSWNGAVSQAFNPNILPTFESFPSKVTTLAGKEEPATGIKMTDPGKALGTIGGLLGVAGAPISAAESGIESLTGNPDFAGKLTDLVAMGRLGKIAKDTMPAAKALKRVDDLLPEDAMQAVERNPSLAPVDISPTARAHADMIAHDTLAPRAKQAVLDFVDQRKGELKGDLTSAVETLGELPTPFGVVKQIQQRARDTGQKIINPIVQSAAPADVTDIVKGIDDVVGRAERSKLPLNDYQRRLVELRDDLRGERPDTPQMLGDVQGDQGLHNVQWKLRAEAQDLLKSSSGAERQLGGKLMDWRNKLVGAIDDAAPGYKDALSKFRTDKDVAEAFDKGLNITKMPGSSSESILEHSGESWRDWAKSAATHLDELSSARLGALSWMAHELEGVRSGKKLLDAPKNPVLQAKLEALFGKDKAAQYINMLEDTNNRALSARIGDTGSQTFERQRAAQASPIRLPGQGHATAATLQSLAPAILGGVAELGLPALGHGTATMLGLGASGARLGYGAAKYLFEQQRYKSDLARRLAEARRLTTPFSKQPDLVEFMRAQREQPGHGNKLSNLASSPLFQAMPR